MKMSKRQKTLFMIAICLAAVGVMPDMVIIPVAGNIYVEFQDAGKGLLNYILSGTAITGAFGSLICSKLMGHIRKKVLLISSFIVFMIGGIFGGAVHNIYYLAAMRTAVGFALGFLCVLTLAIISDVFVDEMERSKAMGIYNAVLALIGAVLSYIAGMVAVSDWTKVFRIYLISVPIIVILCLFIPMDEKTGNTMEKTDEDISVKMPWNKVIRMLVEYGIFITAYSVVYYQVALIVAEKELGNAAVSGKMSSIATVGSFLICTIFGLCYRKLKEYTPSLSYILLLCSFTLLYKASTPLMGLVSCCITGIAYGLGTSYYLMRCTTIVPPSKVSFSLGLTQFAANLLGFFSTYITTILCGILHTQLISNTIPVILVFLVIGGVMTLLTARKKENTSTI